MSSGFSWITGAWFILSIRMGDGAPTPISRKRFKDMTDDPFRSLAGALRRKGGYAKDTTPFSEFLWAEFLRRQIDEKVVEKDYPAAFEAAVGLAKKKEADHLPGWCGPVEGIRNASRRVRLAGRPARNPACKRTGILYATCECRHLPVNFPLRFRLHSFFSRIFQRNHLDVRLTKAQPAPALDNRGKIPNGTPSPPPAPQLSRLYKRVNSWRRNIFNGLLRVPVKKKIPALNSI